MSQIVGFSKCLYCNAIKKDGTWHFGLVVPEAIMFSSTVCPIHKDLETSRIAVELAKFKKSLMEVSNG
jgi:hypothetical protein